MKGCELLLLVFTREGDHSHYVTSHSYIFKLLMNITSFVFPTKKVTNIYTSPKHKQFLANQHRITVSHEKEQDDYPFLPDRYSMRVVSLLTGRLLKGLQLSFHRKYPLLQAKEIL